MSTIRAVRVQFQPTAVSPNLSISTFDPLDLSAPEMQKGFLMVDIECNATEKTWQRKENGPRGFVRYFGDISLDIRRPLDEVVAIFNLEDADSTLRMIGGLTRIAERLLEEWRATQHLLK